MFVLNQSDTYKWPVKYNQPQERQYKKFDLTAVFKRIPQSRLQVILDEAQRGVIDDEKLMDEVLVGWSDIKTTEGHDFEFSEANKRILFDGYTGMRAAFVASFFDSITGIVRKN